MADDNTRLPLSQAGLARGRLHRVGRTVGLQGAGEKAFDLVARLAVILRTELGLDIEAPLSCELNCTPMPAALLLCAPCGVTQMILPATGRRSLSSIRLNSMNTSSPSEYCLLVGMNRPPFLT